MLQLPPPELPEVVVAGARLPPAAGEAAFAVVRLTEADLRAEQRLDEALASVPAVSLFRRTSSLSANPTTQGISLRAIAGLRLAQAPDRSATAGVEWRATGRLTLAADLRWESRRFEDDLNSRVLEAATTADLRAEWAASPSTLIWFAADNLFDAEVEVSETASGVAGFGPPRTLSVGVRLSR